MKNYHIRQYDSPARWFVRRPAPGHEEWLVDLVADECACPDFQFRILPARRRDEPRGGANHAIKDRCIHLVFARNFVLDLLLERLNSIYQETAEAMAGAGFPDEIPFEN